MNIGKLIHFFIAAMLSIFFILGGITCLLTPWSSAIRTHIILFIIENTTLISSFGLLFIILGISLFINVIISSQHRYYSIKSKKNAIDVDENLIQQLVDCYFKELFPEKEIPSAISLKNNKIHITVSLPYFPSFEQKFFLESIEHDLAETLGNILGLKEEFYLSASFKT
ncbi:Conserved putative membrane-associated protein [Waddlia chondrophila 2032/99]|uniref:Conserved putative membrane-associated protein n=2 Tax=Waddlia chondrophila TaxID=71667 RepID=D6YVK6_WADCW|nr:hypothetical protein [Waddlia chondrophila]ADI38167.1 conserved putative membrane-associated protein [Waddlia chondrophila WSU 86-1044]CCB91140.1 Conserved putative membrane-associated protein [Waddlia chondrophila 2032/99]